MNWTSSSTNVTFTLILLKYPCNYVIVQYFESIFISYRYWTSVTQVIIIVSHQDHPHDVMMYSESNIHMSGHTK